MIYMYSHKDIIVYLNLYEVSSLQIQEKSKTPTTYEMELFVTLANGCTPLAHVTWRFIQNITEVLDTSLSLIS